VRDRCGQRHGDAGCGRRRRHPELGHRRLRERSEVQDFTVLANANPADNHGTQDFSIGGGITSNTWQGNKAICETVKVNVTIYKKGVGQTSFTKKTTAAYKGVWADGPMFDMCNLTKTSGSNPPDGTPNAGGSETWRVAVSATQNGTAVPVSARIAFDIIPW
jgi:hypothetical protein